MRYVRASMEDQAKVEHFLSQFVNDDLLLKFPEYLSQKTGGVYIALDEDEVVGAGVASMPRPHEGYIGGIRVSPTRQGEAIESQLAEFQLQEVQRLGAAVVRAVVMDDSPLVEIFKGKLGFETWDEWHVGTIEGYQAPEYVSEVAGPVWSLDHDRILRFWMHFSKDLWADRDLFVPHSLTIEDVGARIEAGSAALAPQAASQEVDTLALYRIGSDDLYIHYLRSLGDNLEALIQYLGIEARAWGINRIRFALPRQTAEQLAEVVQLPVVDAWKGLVLERRLSLAASNR